MTLENQGGIDQVMTGWKIFSGPLDKQEVYHFPGDFVLKAGRSVAVHTRPGENSESELHWNTGPGNGGKKYWGVKGDYGILIDPQGNQFGPAFVY